MPLRFLGPVLLVVVLAGCTTRPDAAPATYPDAATAPVDTVNLHRLFDAIDGPGTFVLWDAPTGRLRVYDPDRARTRFLPASTFKIPNTLIALDTGVADGPDNRLPWDSTAVPRGDWWPRSWARDQTLRSALPNSVVWYYQELARRIGPDRMQAYLQQFDYGNRSIDGGIDRFWLDGGLRISPIEQVAFLHRFYEGRLGVSERATAVARELLVLEETPAYRLSGKTGTAELTATRELGWLVGYVERGEVVSFYALNMEGEQVWEAWPPQKRLALVRSILQALGTLPPPGDAVTAGR